MLYAKSVSTDVNCGMFNWEERIWFLSDAVNIIAPIFPPNAKPKDLANELKAVTSINLF